MTSQVSHSANAAAVGLSKNELETPALCLDLEIYERNTVRMAEFIIGRCGLKWRPHMKGQKVPELARRAVEAGAIGVTCATVYEAEAMVEAGIESILLANQVVGERKLSRVARLERSATVIVATDSATHLEMLSAAARKEGVEIPVVVEVDTGMNRCGVLPGEPTAKLAATACATPGIRFSGLMTWEGHTLLHEDERKIQLIREAITSLSGTAQQCRHAGIPVEIVSCSGSGTYLISGDTPGITEIQAGGGVFCDMAYRRWGLSHEFALTVATRVVSRPAPTRIIVDGGFKSMSFQHGMPQPLGIGNLKSAVYTAEHGILELESPCTTPGVGDLVEFVPGYGDSTVCLHDEMCALRNGTVEAVWAIPGRSGRRQTRS